MSLIFSRALSGLFVKFVACALNFNSIRKDWPRRSQSSALAVLAFVFRSSFQKKEERICRPAGCYWSSPCARRRIVRREVERRFMTENHAGRPQLPYKFVSTSIAGLENEPDRKALPVS